MARPQLGDRIDLRIKRRQEDGTFNEVVEVGKVVKIEDSNDKSKWRLKVKTSSGTYTTFRNKR